ncbi:hypothetical protein GOP47_0009050 [Adiantum capillus-veneris]|uniref:RING-type E3 ubiquitin transferase n=1 Tax=Adiantum capillus-veneris TaxID=13818 RepID=A0A9D4V046_ADICA|nr:hypothetical protein GOP47_0009050 [Adiantum capillus-veneris]
MIALELIPIGTLLTILTGEILDTAFAAHDVLMEKETFRSLSSYFCSITPVLEGMRREIKDSLATQQALESLQRDIGKAKSFVNLYKKKSRFYQLMHCRNIVKTAQDITRDVGNSLALVSLANTEVSVDIRNNVEKLKDQMIHVEYQASQQKLEIVEKIEMGIKEHKTDQAFVNDLIRQIACALGVAVEDSSEMKLILDDFRREKEEAAEKKEREEEAFMEQIIALLSRCTPEVIREEYRVLRSTGSSTEELPPFDTFLCPLSKGVMEDPVSVVTGQTYERARIQEWFACGNNTDPITKQILPVLDLKPNHKLRECIEEWADRNHCSQICNARKKLESGEGALIEQALHDLLELWHRSYKIRHWIAEEQLVALLLELLRSGDKGIRCNILSVLQTIISDGDDNKRQLVDAGGVGVVVHCLARNIVVSKLAVALLVELLQSSSGFMPSVAPLVLERLSQEGESIMLLVTLSQNREDMEAAHNAELVLRKLCNKDENLVEMAKANWFTPLMERLCHGSDDSKLKMATALGDLELTQLSMETLGDKGAIQTLAEMVAGKLEFKVAALRALQNLTSCRANKKRLVEAGAVPLVLDHLFSVRFAVNVREPAAAIFEKLVLTDGTTFLVDANGDALDSGKVLNDLLALQDSLSSASTVRKHVLSSLQGLVSSPLDSEAKKTFKEAHGIAILLPLLERREPEVRDVAVEVLCCLASEHAHEISSFIMEKKLAALLVRLLNNERQGDVAAAAAGILACLPQEDTSLTKELVEENAVSALIHLVSHGNVRLKESAIGALLRFTLPSDIELQRKLVDLGIFTALKGLIYSGTQVSKVRAAIALRNFSASTMKLSTPPKLHRCCCFLVGKASVVCRVHGGQCGEKTTFCLVEAEVVPDLVLLVRNRETDSAGAAVDALSTLVLENENLEKGARFLHDEKAVGPILDLVSHGTEPSKEKSLDLLRKVFKVKKLAGHYADKARILLVDQATHGSEAIGKQATRVLASLENFESSSVY